MSEAITLLRFRVGAAELAVPASFVEEIVDRGPLTAVPGVPAHIPGILGVRGEAVPILDLHRFLGLSGGLDDEERPPRVLVVRFGRYRVGLLCDRVAGVAVFDESQLESPHAAQPPPLRSYARAEIDVGSSIAALLDLPRLLEAARA
jgi:purine-binding chemotaxis protein CheW